MPFRRLDAVVERKGAHKPGDDKSSAEHGTAAQAAQRKGDAIKKWRVYGRSRATSR